MTSFEKAIIGAAHAIVDLDCGAIHLLKNGKGNWRLPCPMCIEREKELRLHLRRLLDDETVKRHIKRGHDKRDGNKSHES